VTLVMRGLEANGVKATSIPAGISGHKSNDMLGGLQNDVLNKKPDWMTLSCGANDVWHGRTACRSTNTSRTSPPSSRNASGGRQGDDSHATMIGEDQPTRTTKS